MAFPVEDNAVAVITKPIFLQMMKSLREREASRTEMSGDLAMWWAFYGISRARICFALFLAFPIFLSFPQNISQSVIYYCIKITSV